MNSAPAFACCMTERLTWYGGVSRKSRSPAYQERYLWLPLQATAGLADGRTYTGNLDLGLSIATEAQDSLLQIGSSSGVVVVLGALSILMASVNIFGGFLVTRRMLAMFERS